MKLFFNGFVALAGLILAIPALAAPSGSAGVEGDGFTPPATPLVAVDPYFSVWSTGKKLTDTGTTHWTGKPHRLNSMVRIDGKVYRLMGAEPKDVPALEQTSVQVEPTRSIYRFEGAGVSLELTFMTPSIPSDIDLLSRPITFVTYSIRSTDDAEHEAAVFLSASGELAVNQPRELVNAEEASTDNYSALRIGSVSQNVLAKAGDDLRIDWGYLYLAAAKEANASIAIGAPERLQEAFAQGNKLEGKAKESKEVEGGDVAAALVLDAGKVGDEATDVFAVLAYDDLYSIEFMGTHLRPYWRRDGMEAEDLLTEAVRDYASLVDRCEAFDKELMADAKTAGGAEYSQICALAYRQCLAAGKFVADKNGQPIQFCKENHSNGCIGTSDVFYPMAPQFLLFGPSMAKSFVAPFMEYAASDRWTFPFAPHDLGTYPKANGQVYGGGERSEENQMPVEESGNMLILMAAIAQLDGDASFAQRYWPQLEQWASYLEDKGFDPDNQLSTDDFSGHLAHNVNLSVKAICGLGSFAQLCELKGDSEAAAHYREVAKKFADRWIEEANDGDHYRLAFDKPGTWSQKYNLVWDRVLGLDLFPDSVREKEMAFYREVQNEYGLPLDNRSDYTKLDWILWTATLTQDREDFQALVSPVYKFLEETPDRSPMTDWYFTSTAKKRGFTARPVVGGVFMQMLYQDDIWQKWAGRDETNAGDYADMPKMPEVVRVVPAGDTAPSVWRFTTKKPAGEWSDPAFDDSDWRESRSGFGTRGTPSAYIGTTWDTSDIWLRREFDLPSDAGRDLKLHIHHDERAKVYLNGVLAGDYRGFSTNYQQLPIRPEAIEALKPTGNVMAVHCHQTTGGQYIDVGLVKLVPVED